MLYEIGEETHWNCTKCIEGKLIIIGLNGEYATCQCNACNHSTKIVVAYGHRKYRKHSIQELNTRFEKLTKNLK